jgi:hypothetical protein
MKKSDARRNMCKKTAAALMTHKNKTTHLKGQNPCLFTLGLFLQFHAPETDLFSCRYYRRAAGAKKTPLLPSVVGRGPKWPGERGSGSCAAGRKKIALALRVAPSAVPSCYPGI